jgi:hypothetical protein
MGIIIIIPQWSVSWVHQTACLLAEVHSHQWPGKFTGIFASQLGEIEGKHSNMEGLKIVLI